MTEVLNTPRIDSNSYYMSTLWYNLSPIQGGLMTTLLLNRSSLHSKRRSFTGRTTLPKQISNDALHLISSFTTHSGHIAH